MFERVPNRPFEWIAPPQASFLEISDWGLDDAITRKIADLLGSRVRVQAIDISQQDFETWTYASLDRHIRELPLPETAVDAYLLVLRDWRGDEIGRSNHHVGGLGLYRRDLSGGRERLGVFASYRLLLVNPDTGEVIVEAPALLSDGHLPWLPAARSLWPRTQNDLTAARRHTLNEDFMKLIDETLPAALRKLGLDGP
ncbi:MAG: hypothetical protein ACREHF_06315 [Rhizomicrobium sp.]